MSWLCAAMKRMPIPALWTAILTTAPLPGLAAEVFRCEMNGVKTFVGSPNLCPNGSGEQVHVKVPVAPAPPSRDAKGSAATPAGRGAMPSAAAKPPPPVVTAAACERQPSSVRTRECLAEVRRAEVRRIATARMASLSIAVSEFVSSPQREPGLIAMHNKGANSRPASWCEALLSDLMTVSNVDVVDDEERRGPEWIESPDKTSRTAAPILDENFNQGTDRSGNPVADGYVTFTWKSSQPIVLRVLSACSPIDMKTKTPLQCNRLRYVSLYLYDSTIPVACNVSFVGEAQWPTWKKVMTPLHVRSPSGVGPGNGLPPQGFGLPPKKERRPPRE